MSIRAYKIIEIKHNPDPTFNCWHDHEIVGLASNPETYGENGGILYFEETVMTDAFNNEDKIKLSDDGDTEYCPVCNKSDGLMDF